MIKYNQPYQQAIFYTEATNELICTGTLFHIQVHTHNFFVPLFIFSHAFCKETFWNFLLSSNHKTDWAIAKTGIQIQEIMQMKAKSPSGIFPFVPRQFVLWESFKLSSFKNSMSGLSLLLLTYSISINNWRHLQILFQFLKFTVLTPCLLPRSESHCSLNLHMGTLSKYIICVSKRFHGWTFILKTLGFFKPLGIQYFQTLNQLKTAIWEAVQTCKRVKNKKVFLTTCRVSWSGSWIMTADERTGRKWSRKSETIQSSRSIVICIQTSFWQAHSCSHFIMDYYVAKRFMKTFVRSSK